MSVNGQTHETSITNLSLGGAQLDFAERLALGQRVRLLFHIPERSDAIEVDATVRWSGTNDVGLQFAGLRPKEVWLLNQYFASLDSK